MWPTVPVVAPLIGITGRRATGEGIGSAAAHLQTSPVDFYFAEYGIRVHESGGLPVEIAQTADPRGYVDRLDGLILTGGGDVDPALWGGPTETSFGVSRERDDFEIALLETALDADVPVLAICRGIQLVNVALGGTLVPHLRWNEGDEHSKRRDDRAAPVHVVDCAEGSLLAGLYGERAKVNSFHHQAVDRPGTGLEITGRSPDGSIEAVEHRSRRLLGVQWHPEMMEPTEPVFGWLLAEAARRGSTS